MCGWNLLDWHLTELAELTVLTVVVYLAGSGLAEPKEKGQGANRQGCLVVSGYLL